MTVQILLPEEKHTRWSRGEEAVVFLFNDIILIGVEDPHHLVKTGSRSTELDAKPWGERVRKLRLLTSPIDFRYRDFEAYYDERLATICIGKNIRMQSSLIHALATGVQEGTVAEKSDAWYRQLYHCIYSYHSQFESQTVLGA